METKPHLLTRWIAALVLSGALLATLFPVAGRASEPKDPLLEPPAINTHPGPEYQDDVRCAAMVIGMDRTRGGRIWGCWTGTGDNVESYFILATSDDGGTTWSKPRVVIDPTDLPGQPPRYSLIGNLWCDPSGRMWLFFDQFMKGAAQTGWYITCDNPDAAEPTWSAPKLMSNGSTLNKPTILKNGDWLLPVALWEPGRAGLQRPNVATDPHEHEPGAHVFGSSDQGRTWKRRGGTSVPAANVNFYEHMIVERRDGSLWMPMRTKAGIEESFSADGGVTWSEPRLSAIKNPSTRFFIRRLASGNLLLVKNGAIGVRAPGRTHLTAFLSEDDGGTWRGGLLLDERTAVTYPDGFQSPDGAIRILYDLNRHGDAEILLATFREEDVLAGKLVSSGARLRHIVNKARAVGLSESVLADPSWRARFAADAKRDFFSVPSEAGSGETTYADAALRELSDGSWVVAMRPVRGEAKPVGAPVLSRSVDQGKTWTKPAALQIELPSGGTTMAGPAEFLAHGKQGLTFFTTQGSAGSEGWSGWMARGDGEWQAAKEPVALAAGLGAQTFARNPVLIRDGRILVPFQHYGTASGSAMTDPRLGVLASDDGGQTWTKHGEIQLGPIHRHFDWDETNLVELEGERIVMLIRPSAAMGLVYVAESVDGGKTWPAAATLRRAPSNSSATYYSLGGQAVAMIHNPGAKLSLWVSFDGMKTWPYQRVLAATTTVGPKEYMSYPHGFVSGDKAWLHVAFVDKRERVMHYSAKLPSLADAPAK